MKDIGTFKGILNNCNQIKNWICGNIKGSENILNTGDYISKDQGILKSK